MKSNFVIFANPRTGSGAFTSALDAQKDIFCLKEIFKTNILDAKYIRRNMGDFLGEDRTMWQKNRSENFKDFLKNFLVINFFQDILNLFLIRKFI